MAALGPKLGEGREAEIFAWRDGSVLRLMRDPTHEYRLRREADAVRAAVAGGAPAPAVGEIVWVEGRPGIVMERVNGPDQLTLLARRPWKVISAAKTLGSVHAQLHEVEAPDELPDHAAEIRERIESNERLPAHLAELALRELDRLPRGDRVCHGDLNPANVLMGRDGPRMVDWVMAGRGDPHADVARTLLLLRIGTPPPGTPRVLAALEGVGRRVIARDYLREYRRGRVLDPELLERWYSVRAADRFWENIVEEDDVLIRLLESRLSEDPRRPTP